MPTTDLKKWSDGKKLLSVLGARQLLAAAPEIVRISESLNSGRWPAHYPQVNVPLKTWLRFYRDHNALQDDVIWSMYRDEGEKQANVAALQARYLAYETRKLQREFRRRTPEENAEELKKRYDGNLDAFNQDLQEWGEVFQEGLQEQDKDFDEFYSGKTPDDDTFKILAPGMHFFLRVWFPCWFLYYEYPTTLFWKARRNSNAEDRAALTKLLKLDKSILFDPKIAEIVHQSAHANTPNMVDKFAREFKSRPKKITRREAKLALMGLVRLFFVSNDKALTTEEMIKLLDAITKAQTKGKRTQDPQFPENLVDDVRRQAARDEKKWTGMFPIARPENKTD